MNNDQLKIGLDNIFVITACLLVLIVMIVTYKRRSAIKNKHLDEALAKINCNNCGEVNDIDALKCKKCGEEIKQDYDFKECRNCGEIYDMKYKKCPYCNIVGYVQAYEDENGQDKL